MGAAVGVAVGSGTYVVDAHSNTLFRQQDFVHWNKVSLTRSGIGGLGGGWVWNTSERF